MSVRAQAKHMSSFWAFFSVFYVIVLTVGFIMLLSLVIWKGCPSWGSNCVNRLAC
jgi:hypothetical protein